MMRHHIIIREVTRCSASAHGMLRFGGTARDGEDYLIDLGISEEHWGEFAELVAVEAAKVAKEASHERAWEREQRARQSREAEA